MIYDFFTQYYWEIGIILFFYFFTVNFLTMVVSLVGGYNALKEFKELNKDNVIKNLKSNSLPKIAMIVPAYNESEIIVECLKNLHDISYHNKEIILVNDGSTDNTLQLLIEAFNLEQTPVEVKRILKTKLIRGVYKSKCFPDITVIDKENGLKHDALNAGLNVCSCDYVITIDADTFIDSNQFESIIRPLYMHPETIAVGVGVRIANYSTLKYHSISLDAFRGNYFIAMQSLEYLRLFMIRQGFNYFGGNFCLSGAFTAFSYKALMNVEGFAPTFANDLEIIIRLHRYYLEKKIPYKIVQLSEPVAWTHVPENYKTLKHQRILWHRGLLESLWFHKRLFFTQEYNIFGFFVLNFALFAEALEPIIELIAYFYVALGVYLGLISWTLLIVIIGLSWGCTLLASLFAYMIEVFTYKKYRFNGNFFKLIAYSFIENFGYRQMTIFWRIQGFLSFYKRFEEVKKDYQVINARFRYE